MTMHTTEEQIKAAKVVERALRKAAKAGLLLRVFGSRVLLVTVEHLEDPRYLSSGLGMNDWMDEALEVGGGILATGGAGV